MSAELSVRGLEKRFGKKRVVNDVSFSMREGEVVGFLGPNGAGKTTVFNLLTGVLRPSAGRIVFRGHELTGRAAHRFAAAGIARTFQNVRLFRGLSVLENVMAALHGRHGAGLLPTLLGLPGVRRSEAEIRRRAEETLALLGLEPLARETAAELTYGDQRRVEIARALAAEPRLLLLDEPSAGMNPQETAELLSTISTIHRRFGLTIIVVEHDMKLVMKLSQRVQVLNRGRVLALGRPEEVQNDPAVVGAYLGHKRARPGHA